ncbi:MAG: NAD(P)-dependent oxidoreductase, partial [Candidatus Saccharimonadales bacterium]
VVVFGSTGQTGQHVVGLLVAEGHAVTAFARNPAKVNTYNKAKVRIIQGDGRNSADVASAVKGQDAVIAAFGPRSLKKDDIQEVFIKNVINAMNQYNLKRFIELSAWGAGDSLKRSKIPFKIVRKTILKNVFDDKDRGEALIANSNLDYTNVRPGRLTNRPAQGNVRTSLSGRDLSASIARADVASFMVGQLEDSSWLRKSPLIGY